MRVVHLTDLHVQRPPPVGSLFSKRLLGAANLYLAGRKGHFSAATAEALVPAVLAQAPDLVVCSGDLTAMALEEEFEAAKALLAPVRAAARWLCIPGNHDVYTADSVGRFAAHFGETAPVRVVEDGAAWVLVDVCHPDWASRGWLGEAGRAQLREALGAGAIVVLHYPLRNRRGEAYGPWTRACVDAAEIEAICLEKGASAVLHGHEHHGFRTQAAGLPIYDPGASGYAFLPEKGRSAHFCVYDVQGGRIVGVERLRFDGTAFVPEPGGAWATGG